MAPGFTPVFRGTGGSAKEIARHLISTHEGLKMLYPIYVGLPVQRTSKYPDGVILSSPQVDSTRKHPFANRVESAEKQALSSKTLRLDL